jgi:hypothetical protein
MYTSFTVRNFRCFDDMTVEPLAEINLIAGKNDVGKTALLEALFLHCGAYNPTLAIRVNVFRGFDIVKVELSPGAQPPWESLFSGFDTSIELEGENTETGSRLLRLRVVHDPSNLGFDELAEITSFVPKGTYDVPDTSGVIQLLELAYEEAERSGDCYLVLDSKGIRSVPVPPRPPFNAFFQAARLRIPFSEDASRFGRLQILGNEDVLLQVLRILEPRLRRLTVIVEAGQPIIQGDIGLSRPVPLPLMGEGVSLLASLVLAISTAPGGVVLIDEIENGLHYSILPLVWQAIAETAKSFNTQIFATTHSFECIRAAHEALNRDDTFDFRLHRLERLDDKIKAVTFSRKQLATAIATDLEVR